MASYFGMAWKAAARLFKASHRLNRKRFLIYAALVLLISPTLLMHFFFWKIERGLDLKIYRKPFFALIPGFIRIQNISLAWRDHLTVDSGSVAVQYPVWMILMRELPISLKGENLVVKFGPKLKQMVASDHVVFDHVKAELIIGSTYSDRRVKIESLDAESKTIKFHLTRKSGNSPVSMRSAT